jgi:phosphohistidine phosphatase SixA
MNERVCGFGRVIACAALITAALAATPLRAAEPAAAAAPARSFVEIPATAQTLKALRGGGFVLYLRHGNTDNSRPDRQPAVDLDDCSTQRPLTEEGRVLSANVGEAIRRARIPLAEIRVSPLCRARDSAAAAFPDQERQVDLKLMYTANLTDAQKAPIIAHTRELLSAPPPPASNRLLVAHAPNLMDLIGYFPKEGTLVVFRPLGSGDGAGFAYVASIAPALWQTLLH